MRSAVYNRFWHSQGGGERHAGMVAQVLSRTPEAGQVELVGHSPVDLDELGTHLGLDLSRCVYRQIPGLLGSSQRTSISLRIARP